MKYCGIDFQRWLAGFDTVEQSVTDTVDTIRNHPLMPGGRAHRRLRHRHRDRGPHHRMSGVMVSLAARPDQGTRPPVVAFPPTEGAGGGIPGQHPVWPACPGARGALVVCDPLPSRGDLWRGWGSSPRTSTTGRTSPPNLCALFVEGDCGRG